VRLRREIHDRRGRVGGKQRRHVLPPGDVPLDEGEPRVVLHVLEAREVAGVRELVEDDDPSRAVLQRVANEVRADEPGAAGDDRDRIGFAHREASTCAAQRIRSTIPALELPSCGGRGGAAPDRCRDHRRHSRAKPRISAGVCHGGSRVAKGPRPRTPAAGVRPPPRGSTSGMASRMTPGMTAGQARAPCDAGGRCGASRRFFRSAAAMRRPATWSSPVVAGRRSPRGDARPRVERTRHDSLALASVASRRTRLVGASPRRARRFAQATCVTPSGAAGTSLTTDRVTDWRSPLRMRATMAP
jgi:hypothetical protein